MPLDLPDAPPASTPPPPSRAWRGHARRLAAEFVVIVLGVLVALGVDSWREGRDERALAQQYLEGFATDLEADSGHFELLARATDGQRRAAREILAADAAFAAERGTRGMVELHKRVVYMIDLATAGATYQDLVSTGNLRLIADPELRREIVAYHSYRDWTVRVLRDTREGLGLLAAEPAYAALLPYEAFATDDLSGLPDAAFADVSADALLPANPDVRRHLEAVTVYHAMIEQQISDNLRRRNHALLRVLRGVEAP